MEERLRLERQPLSGWRHFIGDDSIHCGERIEICASGKWVAGRYEAEGLHITDSFPIACLWVDESNYIKLRDGIEARLPHLSNRKSE